MALELRPYRPEDFGFVADLFERYLAAEAERTASPSLSPEFARRYLPRLVKDARSEPGVFVIAEWDRDRAGYAAALAKAAPDPWDATGGRAGLLMELHVHPAFRRRGIARALLQAVEEHFRSRGFDWMALGVFAGNGIARELYRGVGYRETYVFCGKPLTARSSGPNGRALRGPT
jgi:ribosomal protein S18 acetylase RimI-like enzyme